MVKAIVQISSYTEGDMLSGVTSKGASWAQALHSNGPMTKGIMDEWVKEQAAANRVIWEINWDLANLLMGWNDRAEALGYRQLPADLVSELVHRFPDLGAKCGQRDKTEGSGQSVQATSGSEEAAPVERDCERPHQAQEQRI